MAKVLVFGTFDIFHQGHKNFLKQARRQGDFLRVVVARDATVLALKGRAPLYLENERAEAVEKSVLANEVVLGSLGDKYEAVRMFEPDVICLGYDQEYFVESLRKMLDDAGLDAVKIVRLKPYKPYLYKSSLLRKQKGERRG